MEEFAGRGTWTAAAYRVRLRVAWKKVGKGGKRTLGIGIVGNIAEGKNLRDAGRASRYNDAGGPIGAATLLATAAPATTGSAPGSLHQPGKTSTAGACLLPRSGGPHTAHPVCILMVMHILRHHRGRPLPVTPGAPYTCSHSPP